MRGFILSRAVGRGTSDGNRLADTMKLKLGLERLGYYSPGPRGFIPGPDDELWSGLERYQGDRGLEVDALALPGGPTLAALNSDLEAVPDASILTGDPLAPVSPEAAASNRRMARSLARARDPGDVPPLMVAALKSGGDNNAAENADLLAQIRDHAPDQADTTKTALADMIGDDDAARLDDASRARSGEEASPKESASKVEGGDRFDALLGKLYPREGGYMIDPIRGETFKGVTEDTLKEYNKLHPEKGFPDKVTEMTEEQRADFYRNEFYQRPQIDKLARIRGLQEAAPQLAEQMFDAGVLHGPETAGKWLQAALDRYTGSHLVRDGIMGKETRGAIEDAIRNGTITDVSNMVVDKRLEAMRNNPNFSERRGWPKRAESFRR